MRTDGADPISPPRQGQREVPGPSQAVWQEAPRPPPRALVGALGQRVVRGGHEEQPADPGLRGTPGDKRSHSFNRRERQNSSQLGEGAPTVSGAPEQQRPVPDPGLRRLFPPVRSRGREGARERGRLSGVCVTRALVPSRDSSNTDHLPGSRLLTLSRRHVRARASAREPGHGGRSPSRTPTCRRSPQKPVGKSCGLRILIQAHAWQRHFRNVGKREHRPWDDRGGWAPGHGRSLCHPSPPPPQQTPAAPSPSPS